MTQDEAHQLASELELVAHEDAIDVLEKERRDRSFLLASVRNCTQAYCELKSVHDADLGTHPAEMALKSLELTIRETCKTIRNKLSSTVC